MSFIDPTTEKPTIGASIHPIATPGTSDLDPLTQKSPLHTNTHNNPSTTSLPAPTPNTEAETYDPTSTDPFSPFYSHARASESRSRVHIRSSTSQDVDLEKGHPSGITISNVPSTVSAAANLNLNNTPSQQHPHRFSKCHNKQSLLCRSEAKNAQGWWRNLSKRQKVLVHLLIGLIFIGAVTGLGVGVSKAMGTGIWKTESASEPIGRES
ncbi:MAG: hypothetical protein Q9178_006174 [Gyalolechia marmorata]